MLKNKSRLEALHGVKELDNRAAEAIWGGKVNPANLHPESVYIPVGPHSSQMNPKYLPPPEPEEARVEGSGVKPEVLGKGVACTLGVPWSLFSDLCQFPEEREPRPKDRVCDWCYWDTDKAYNLN